MNRPGTLCARCLVAVLIALCAFVWTASAQPSAGDPATQPQQVEPAAPSSAPDIPSTPAPAQAQQPAGTNGDTLQPLRERADGWKIELDGMILAMQRPGLGDEQLAAMRARAETIIAAANEVVTQLEPMLTVSRNRLGQLGPAPAEGDPSESAAIAAMRAAYGREVADIDAVLKLARLDIVQAEQVVRDVASTRRERFTSALTTRSQSILNPRLWIDGIAQAPRLAHSLRLLVTDSWGVARTRIDAVSAVSAAVALVVAILIGVVLRRMLRRLAPPVGDTTEIPRLKKLARAAFVLISDGVIPTVALLVFYMALNTNGLLTSRLAELCRGAILGAGVAAFLFGLSRGLLAPLRPGWRPVPLSDAGAAQTVASVALIAVVIGFTILSGAMNAIVMAPLPVEMLKHAVSSLLLAVFMASGLWRLTVEWHKSRGADASAGGSPGILWPWLRGLAWLLIAAIFAALVLGYLALAYFLAVQLILAGVVLSVAWLVMGLIDETTTTLFAADHRVGIAMGSAFGVSGQAVMQIGLLASGLLRLVVLVLAAVMVLLPWGFDTGQWNVWIRKAFFGFRIGEVTISLSTILTAVVLFAVGAIATRALQSWLGNRFLPNTRLDLGLRNSIRTVVGYAGVIVAGLFAVSYMGINLENVALLAGALSVGIGFGLQSIVNNFVSGLILLAERPIKEGDWIVVGAEQGNVRRISIRSTEIETFDRATVIVPNSDLITGAVKNWMHSSMMGRVEVAIGVGYDSDPEKVRDILLDIARSHTSVLAYPEPRVFFMDFGDSALVFKLFAFVGDVNTSATVRSDFRFELLKRLREAGIEIPFPQRDLNIKGAETPPMEVADRVGEPPGSSDPSDVPDAYRPRNDTGTPSA